MITLPRLLACSLLLPAAALAQSQFVLRVQQGSNIVQVSNGSTLSFNSPAVGANRTGQILITYIGSTSVSFPDGFSLLGSSSFTLRSITGGTPGSQLLPNQTATIEVAFKPSSTALALAQFDLNFVEAPPPSGQSVRGLLTLGLAGGVPSYSLSYSIGAGGNTTVLQPDGQLVFPNTVTNSDSLAAMTLSNRGSGAGQVTSVSVAGASFSLASLPALPSVVAPSAALTFQVLYQPRQVGNDAGTLTLSFDGGVTQTYQLQGRGISSQFSYELLAPGAAPSPIVPNQAIQFSQTSVGQTSRLQVRYTNISGADVPLASVTSTGPPYVLSDLPLVPSTVPPQGSGTFTISFSPTQPGRPSGSLRFGNDTFPLAGEALGPSLSYSYRTSTGSDSIAVDPSALVTMPTTAVGRASTLLFVIENRGTAAAVFNSIGVASTGDSFTVIGLPSIPYQLQPQSSVSFTIQFLPNNVGFATGSLRIDSTTFALSGLGGAPVPLSDFTIGGPTQANPLEQPALSITLSQPYPIALFGVLTLAVASDYGADPSVQFITGGRTVSFSIPPGATRAVFPNGSNEIRMQTGSVAASYTVAPTFSTQSGLEITPSTPKTLRFSMPTSAPKILGVQVAERGVSTLTLRVLGLTTNRSLGKLTLGFTAVQGFNVPNLNFSLDLSGGSAVWFSSAASQSFGGQFAIDVQFLLSTTDRSTSATPPTQTLQSVAVAVSSSTGDSNTVTVQLR